MTDMTADLQAMRQQIEMRLRELSGLIAQHEQALQQARVEAIRLTGQLDMFADPRFQAALNSKPQEESEDARRTPRG